MSFSPTSFSYQAGRQQRPTVRVAEQGYAADSYYEVKDFEINEGHSFAAEQKDSGRFAFSDDDPELDDYDIDVEVVGDEDTECFAFDDVSPGDEGEVLMEIDEDGEFDMDVDTDGSSDEVDTDDDALEDNADAEGEDGLKTAAIGEDDGSGESADDQGSAVEESAEDQGYAEGESGGEDEWPDEDEQSRTSAAAA